MSHNTLIAKIESDAQAAVAEIESKQASAVAIVDSETEALIAEKKAQHDKVLEKKLHHLELVALSQAKQNANIALQTAKRNQIDSVFETVLKSIIAKKSDEYVSFFSKLAKDIMPSTAEVTSVVTAVGREEEAKKIITSVESKGVVTVDKNISGGIIVHTKEGVYDITLDRLFSDKRAEMEMEVVKSLTS
jgi:vacuolar-type H+-ATPase subunit E/Vma4